MPGSSSGVEPTATSFTATSPILMNVLRLKEEQAALRKERARLAQELKNAERRRKRLKGRAKLLTDAELMAVINLRQDEKVHAVAKKTAHAPAPPATATPGVSAAATSAPTVTATAQPEPDNQAPSDAELPDDAGDDNERGELADE